MVLLRSGTFIVFEGSNVIITQFGKIVGQRYDKPGLYFRIPLIQRANYFDVRLQLWEGHQNYVPTKDKLYVGVETTVVWKINDPELFLQTLSTENNARDRIESILHGAVKDVVASHALVDTVRSTNNVLAARGKSDKIAHADITDGMSAKVEDDILSDLESVVVGRVHLTNQMLDLAATDAAALGIKIHSVFIKKLSYLRPVELMVYDRMISERLRVAERLRSIGRSESERIRGEAAQRVQEIISPAVRESEVIKGEADAEATATYGKAFGQDPDFYRFWRTLAAYRKALPEQAAIIDSLDSNFFRMMRGRSDSESTASAAVKQAQAQPPVPDVEAAVAREAANDALGDSGPLPIPDVER